MHSPASDLAIRLGRHAEAVCRRYLSRGTRNGSYWNVGDVHNTPGRSLFVRLIGPETGPGAAGHWTDAATGEHGDLLDLVGLACGLTRLRDSMDEARAFLALPRTEPKQDADRPRRQARAPASSPQAARQLFHAGQPIRNTPAETYLATRGLVRVPAPCLRFHPRVFYRATRDAPRQTWPALLAAVTALDGRVMGVQRTWLDPSGTGKAPIEAPRRALGHLLGHGVRFGAARDVMAAGEGIETVLSLRLVLPRMPLIAALSANHLAALELPPTLRRLYVVPDPDAAGRRAAERLRERAEAVGIEVRDLVAGVGDFNDALRTLGRDGLVEHVRGQLVSADATRFTGELAGRTATRMPRSREPEMSVIA